MIDDHAPTEIRPRNPLPPAPARHLPVAQPDSRYSRGVVVVTMDNTAATFTPHEPRQQHVWTDIEPVAPHPVDVRPEYRPRHRTDPAPYAARPIAKARWWETWTAGYGLGIATGAVAMFAWFLLMRLVSA